MSNQMTELKIISGALKGAKLHSPNLVGTHPMGAREKNALFNMANPAGLVVLDAYAGSGALGFEALSRGAEKVVFVEKSAQACQTIRNNLASLVVRDAEIKERVELYQGSVAAVSRDLANGMKFELIIADPPYERIELAEIEELVQLLTDDGMLILSSPAKQEPLDLNGVKLLKTRTYARARLSVYLPET